LILKDDIKIPINELMSDLEKHVKSIAGYEIKLSSKEMDKDIQVPDEFVYMTSEPGTKNNELVAMTDNEAANLLLKELNEFALKIDLRPGQTTRPKFHKGKYDDCVDSLALANKASEEIYGDVSLRGIE
jgi:hypothetical protein